MLLSVWGDNWLWSWTWDLRSFLPPYGCSYFGCKKRIAARKLKNSNERALFIFSLSPLLSYMLQCIHTIYTTHTHTFPCQYLTKILNVRVKNNEWCDLELYMLWTFSLGDHKVCISKFTICNVYSCLCCIYKKEILQKSNSFIYQEE